MMDYISQVYRIRKWLEMGGTVSSIEAFRLFRITRLSRVIHELRQKGCPIISEREDNGKHGAERKFYSRYRIKK
jgi:hypothetical protein